MNKTTAFDKEARTIQWIPVKNLAVIYREAQRPFDETHAQHIADNFDPDMFGVLSVTFPNGRGIYHIVDGQHRKTAVESLWGPEETVPCNVVGAENKTRSAKLFDVVNTERKKPSPLEIFKVRVTAENKDEVAVNTIVRRLGFSVDNLRQESSIAAVASLLAVYRKHGAKTLEATLQILQATWHKDPNAVVAPLIRGYGDFLSEYGKLANWQRLTDCGRKHSPGKFLAHCKAKQEALSCNLPHAVKFTLVSQYNGRGLRNLKRLPLPSA